MASSHRRGAKLPDTRWGLPSRPAHAKILHLSVIVQKGPRIGDDAHKVKLFISNSDKASQMS